MILNLIFHKLHNFFWIFLTQVKEFIAKRNQKHNFKATSNKVTLTRILNFFATTNDGTLHLKLLTLHLKFVTSRSFLQVPPPLLSSQIKW
jgi:hypothetical protein